jgi:transcriptional regulator with XRE-family HTH domain
VRRYDPDKLVRDVGRRVAELRRERDLTQQALATKLRASTQWVQQIEYGSNLTLFSLARLANVLDVPLEEFLVRPQAASYVISPGRPAKGPRAEVVAEDRGSARRKPSRK